MATEATATSNIPQAFITPRLLRWARNRSGLSVPALAWRLHVEPEVIRAWENDRSQEKPDFLQAQKLAQILHVPFGYLFLSNPPSEKPPIPDLRTVANRPYKSLTPDFIEVLNDALRKQEWYREFRKSEGEEKLAFIGRHAKTANDDLIATDIADTLGINDKLRNKVANWEEFLTELIDRCESQNILVIRNSVVKKDNTRALSVEEFRGFVITDDFAPLIFLNGEDSKAAQIFTLVHELAHLWLGESGISNSYLASKAPSLEIEQRCNRIAAQVLVPREAFNIQWGFGGDSERIERKVGRVCKRFRVSGLVALRRAYDLEKIPWNEYVRLYRLYEKRYAKKGRGGSFYALIGSRSSKRLMGTLLSSVIEGKITYRDGAALLNVGPTVLRKIIKSRSTD